MNNVVVFQVDDTQYKVDWESASPPDTLMVRLPDGLHVKLGDFKRTSLLAGSAERIASDMIGEAPVYDAVVDATEVRFMAFNVPYTVMIPQGAESLDGALVRLPFGFCVAFGGTRENATIPYFEDIVLSNELRFAEAGERIYKARKITVS